jgi:hypothetical protein
MSATRRRAARNDLRSQDPARTQNGGGRRVGTSMPMSLANGAPGATPIRPVKPCPPGTAAGNRRRKIASQAEKDIQDKALPPCGWGARSLFVHTQGDRVPSPAAAYAQTPWSRNGSSAGAFFCRHWGPWRRIDRAEGRGRRSYRGWVECSATLPARARCDRQLRL